MENKNIKNRVVHFEIQADDVERAKKFYESSLGWKIEKFNMPDMSMDYWAVNTGEGPGISGGLFERKNAMGKLHSFDCTVLVDDIDKVIKEIKVNGGKITPWEGKEKWEMKGLGWFSRAMDTEGNTFGLIQATEWKPEDMSSDKKDVTFVRMLGSSQEKVFKAWTDEKQMKKWWGPRGMENSVCEINPKVGGKINIVMKAGKEMGQMAGQKFPMSGEFTEVNLPNKLMFKAYGYFPGKDEPQIEQLTAVNFEEMQGMTKMTVNVKIIKASEFAGQALEGMEQGWSESFYKLAELLDGM